MIGRVAFALILGAVISTGASAQTPVTTPPTTVPAPAPPTTAAQGQTQTQARPALSDAPPPPPTPAALPPRDAPAPARKAAVPAPAAREDRDVLSSQGRFANPGGIGKHREYYTPFTPMTTYQPQPNRVAGFDRGGGPTRADQVNAFRAGQFRTQNLQNNINTYGRPIGFGFGYGFGGYGGYR